ncbi:hypothetical protein DM02DRAFT_620917 [Periconia macrospinosa]|uniref:N-acetyltransferase domain-containing protein n=1 Tax=Periconia macrospinosa TaxID=97972 RepID=A0A2V1CZK3_9PLEO|nr:hypothetical protein DM02DRAFT_620917 [Periconia macrospinosa]
MDPILETPRLKLIRITDTDPSSQHAKWFYEMHSDEGATSWAVSGACKSFEEAHARMIGRVVERDIFEYAVFAKPESNDSLQSTTDAATEPGELVGGVSLRKMPEPTVPAPPPPVTEGEDASSKTFQFRTMGYGFKRSAWGKGYATEANIALLEAFTRYSKKVNPTGLNYVEAGAGVKNLASARVIQKLGLSKVGWKEEPEDIFLGGEWQTDKGYWLYGKYL